ncbi:hypothetical protein PoHVEF18_010512 [Penicillium ochrochloron]
MTKPEFWEILIGGDFTTALADESEAVVHTPIRSLVCEDPEVLQSSERSSPDCFLLDDKALKVTEIWFYWLQKCSCLEAPSSENTGNGQTLRGHLDWVLSVGFSRDDQLLATTSRDNTVGLWDVATGALQQTLEGHSDWVLSVAFSRDSRLLATGSRDNTVRLWDTVTGSLGRTLEGHSDWVRSIAFSHDGRLLATGSGDNTVRLWDMARGSLQRTLEGHSDWVRSIAFSHDGRLLATGSGDSTVRLWDMTTGVPQQTLNVKGLVTNLEFAEDGLYLMTNLGYLNTHIPYEDHTSGSPKARTIRFLVEDQWLTLRGEKVLWLPPEYRPGCSAVSDNTLALGHSSERISIIEFRA